MTPIPDRATFETLYAGQAPWDIGKPHKAFIGVAGRITGSVPSPAEAIKSPVLTSSKSRSGGLNSKPPSED